MAILEIAQYPEKCLRQKADIVTEFDEDLKLLVKNMSDTMYNAPGVGLAAPQVRILKRIFVLDTTEEKNDFRAFVNPTILQRSGMQSYEEGCLSIPQIYEKVKRPEFIVVEAQDENGDKFKLKAEGLLAVCIQHEMDHLDGILFLDHLSRLKQARIIKKLDKALKTEQNET